MIIFCNKLSNGKPTLRSCRRRKSSYCLLRVPSECRQCCNNRIYEVVQQSISVGFSAFFAQMFICIKFLILGRNLCSSPHSAVLLPHVHCIASVRAEAGIAHPRCASKGWLFNFFSCFTGLHSETI